MRCLAHVLERGRSSTGEPLVTSSPTPIGLTPVAIQSAYQLDLSPTAGAGQTIAIVDAYDAPTVESDLATFSNQYGLPPCTTTNGCFEKVDQTGGTNYPVPNGMWTFETDLDVQWAHVVAPGARILLVEANSAYWPDMLAAEDFASAHAPYVSNSWGALEFAGETDYDTHFSTPGASYFVASGDNGAGVLWPSASPGVVSVGGTTLQFDSSGSFVQESAWSRGGGGCSGYELANPAQAAFAEYQAIGCTYTGSDHRGTPDVSFDADPASGVSVYDSTPYYSQTGWWQVGGTSAGTPMFAARAAVAGVRIDAATVYSGSTIPFRDITAGSNGYPATAGYDLATGRGTWAVAPAPPSTTTTTTLGTTPATATAPQNITAVAGNAKVALAWIPPTSPSGATFSYNVYRATATTAPTRVKSSLTATSYTDGSRTNGTTYSYWVTAVNGGRESAASNVVQATPMTVPKAPQNLSAKTALTSGVVLTWKPPSSNGGSAINGYALYRSTASHAEVLYVTIPCSTGSVSACAFSDTSTVPGVVYYYQLGAVNAVGAGPLSSQVQARAH